MTTPSSNDSRFHLELLKLLLQVAWSDDAVDPREARALLGAAHRWNVPLEEVARLEQCLDQGKAMPAPNLGLLRQRPDDVLATVRTLIATDTDIHLSEKEMIAQIRELLGVTAG
ncbi:MAG TPA: TerB family tellurite resistance protein [Myxococcaceae bacterium]|nr:TerB family tellurite resistance protein [Myxococcaceae bacterium]